MEIQSNSGKRESTMENKTIDKMIACIGCPCHLFHPNEGKQAMMAAYREARERGAREGFIPVLVAAEDTILLECLEMNQEEVGGAEAARQAALSAPVEDGGAYFASLLPSRKEEAEDNGFDWPGDAEGDMTGGEAMDSFYGMDEPLLLAEVPVKNPWEVFAYLPFGGWNECPDTAGLMAAAKSWYERFGAVPAMVTHDVLQFTVPKPVAPEQAMELALEQYAWCPDIVDQGCESVGSLADTLAQSTVWFFWWD